MRTLFDPSLVDAERMYALLTASVVPRPIAWVSTRGADGSTNLAPYSFFTVASTDPPVVQFTSVTRKDSLRNIEESGEFVVNLATASLIDRVNASSAVFDADVSEFDAVGLTPEPSDSVRPPRVAESPVAIECGLHRVIAVGNSFVVMGAVRAISVRTDALAEDGLPDFAAIAPVSRLGRAEWGLPPRVRVLQRPGRPQPS
ncbi:flavin reductase family protein [Rhodococcus sp. NPDC127528]|uniref:flavin reductase family protein n=1 Tax=unclassified Rhodococcus (in: high G+C Gram-positive bacteria) TaxID=192944 RepID=UPI00362F6809